MIRLSLPGAYVELLDEIMLPDPSFDRIAEIASQDVALSAKMLQVVNSAFFSLRWRITSVRQAVGLLGLRATSDLALSVSLFSRFDAGKLWGLPVADLGEHSARTGGLARAIAKHEDAPRDVVDDAFVGGLLHDAGKLILADRMPDAYEEVFRQAKANQLLLPEAEFDILGATHAEVGACLLGQWGLPDHVLEAVAFHHNPEMFLEKEFSAAADVFELEGRPTYLPYPAARISAEFLEAAGLTSRLGEWLSLCV